MATITEVGCSSSITHPSACLSKVHAHLTRPSGTHRDIHNAMREWHGLLFGLLSILVFTVIIGVMAVRGLLEAGAYPHGGSDFSMGMMIFFSIPTTLNMGIVVCEQAGGNGAVAVSSVLRRNNVVDNRVEMRALACARYRTVDSHA